MDAEGASRAQASVFSERCVLGRGGRIIARSTKWAMEGFSRCMALELASSGIRVSTFRPTSIETPMTKPFCDDGRATPSTRSIAIQSASCWVGSRAIMPQHTKG
ncbi:SDR family NAD(P)-dependent oxidoreductase [Rhizobium sp. BK313]|uniref:SDR family NAD(P)-dependent oxidoreductase n=1 Tax=Rhizobium sp. BK313 TaxID=2587081 RepID=UPI0028AC0D45|nr:SDR family NAD(P)-dependent oxidoreductase [Rhizobium sp. BK313]